MVSGRGGRAGHGKAGHGMQAWQGKARRGVAGQGMALRNRSLFGGAVSRSSAANSPQDTCVLWYGRRMLFDLVQSPHRRAPLSWERASWSTTAMMTGPSPIPSGTRAPTVGAACRSPACRHHRRPRQVRPRPNPIDRLRGPPAKGSLDMKRILLSVVAVVMLVATSLLVIGSAATASRHRHKSDPIVALSGDRPPR